MPSKNPPRVLTTTSVIIWAELFKIAPQMVRGLIRRWLRLSCLLQLRVLGFGFLQDGDVRVGVFPKGEEILIGSTGFGCVTADGIGAGEAPISQRAE